MNEGLANGAGDFNVFSALNGDANFQDLSSEIDDDAAELNLVEAVASGEKIDTSFAEESEVEATEKCLDAERRSEICQNVASAACDSCAAAGNCPILRMRNFAEENLRLAAKEPESYLADLMEKDGCGFVVAGYVSADNEEKASESIEKDSPSEKPAVKSEVSDDDASMRVSAESNEANKPTDDECLDSESVSSENIPSAKIIKENIPPKINEDPDETEAINQINLVDSEDINEKVDIHKEDVSSENQAPAVDKEDELPRELPKKKDSYIGNENDINSVPILEDSTPRDNLVEKVIPNETNSSPVRDFVQVNNEIDVAMNELIENKKDSSILPQRDFEKREVCFEDSENVAVAEISDGHAVVSKTDNAVDDLGDCIELSEEAMRESDDLGDRVELDEEGVCELEELPTSKSEVIGQFIPDLKLADNEIGHNNVVDEVVKKVAGKTELTEEYSELVATDDCDKSKCSVKIEESSDYCDDTDNVLNRDLNIPVFQEFSTLLDDSSEEKANYNCDEDGANNTNISGVYSGLWVDDSPLNPEDDKTSNVSYNSSVLFQLIALVGSLAVRIAIKKQEELCK
ncbi:MULTISPECIES: hypothetical protein [unclassified Candidatus Nanosynbacter]|uniref:hypothetical protein n=1 Tax=unclassified Candidatus Nanosynbacter TaxID=2725944 RepID=UPI001FB85957|nr:MULTISPECIES: hypothetical protein [unclassified Candidatus Nanosynbacter]MCJ1963617.1 hypothetical protein [Candidatus Nanosynbacter sp. TM7-033]UOG68100.1 hypothetical protein LRM46_01075 [Candidatus Nanosynbacter sp. HMT-352]